SSLISTPSLHDALPILVDVDRVLLVRQQHALLENHVVHLVAPDGQALLQAEFRQVIGPVQFQGVGTFFAAEEEGFAAGQAEQLRSEEHTSELQSRSDLV